MIDKDVLVFCSKIFLIFLIFELGISVMFYSLDRHLCYRDGVEMGLETKYSNFTCYVKDSDRTWIKLNNYRGFLLGYGEIDDD